MVNESILNCNLFDLADRVFDTYQEVGPFDFGPYRILEAIGRGGMGEVYLAEDLTAGRRVAIKFLRDVWADSSLIERFGREIRTLAALEHPFIARLYDHGISPEGTPWFAMEYVDGKPIDDYCRERECSLDNRMRLFHFICEGVQYAHGRAVIHLDLKPANILVKSDGTPKLLDFGIAKHLENPSRPANQTQLRFTPAFAAPEQILRQPVGTYTDVYGLGLVLYQLLAGKPPYQLDNCTPTEAEAIVIGDGEPEKPSQAANHVGASRTAWRDLDVLCLKALRKDVQRRYQSALELTQDMDRFLTNEPLKARPDTLAYRAGKFVRRNLKLVVVSATVIAFIAGLTAFYTVRLARARDAALIQANRVHSIQRFMLNMLGASDKSAPPSRDLRVLTMLDRAAADANHLNDPATQAELHETLGHMYRMLGNSAQADAQLQLALDKARTTGATAPADLAHLLIEIGNLRGDQSRFEEAQNSIQSALHLIGNTSSPADPLLFEAKTALASVYTQRGSDAQAIDVLAPLIKIKPAGPESDYLLSQALNVLGYAEVQSGEHEQSKTAFNRELSLDREVYGDSHAQVGIDLANLATIKTNEGHFPEAEVMYREAVKILSSWYGDKEPEVVLQLNATLAQLLVTSKPTEAHSILEHVIAAESSAGQGTGYAWALDAMGRLELVTGEPQKAENHFDTALAIDKALFGDDNPRTAMAEFHLAQAIMKQRRYAEAEPLIRRSLKALPMDAAAYVTVLVMQVALGQTLVQLHRYREAEGYLLSAYSFLQDRHTPPLLKSREDALRNLAIVYHALGEPAKAAQFKRQMLTNGNAGRR